MVEKKFKDMALAKIKCTGEIVEILSSESSADIYKVISLNSGKVFSCLGDDLVLFNPPKESDFEQKIKNGEFKNFEAFKETITREKITGKLTDYIDYLGYAGSKYEAFQFMPLVKLLFSSHKAVLISDDFGVDKKAQALLIWKELQAKEDAKTALILCPEYLAGSWKKVMEESFNLNREVLISPLELVNEKTLSKLEENKDKPLFDLLIIDRANEIKDLSSDYFRIARLFVENSSRVVFLSESAINSKTQSLFPIMNLIDPQVFVSQKVIHDCLKFNEQLVALRNLFTAEPFDPSVRAGISNALDSLLSTRCFKRDIELNKLKEDLNIKLNFDISRKMAGAEVSKKLFLKDYVSRVRREDLPQQKICKRMSRSFIYSLNEFEKEFYQASLKSISSKYNDLNTEKENLILIQKQRQLESCFVGSVNQQEARLLSREVFGKTLETENTAMCTNDDLLKKLRENDSKYKVLKKFLTTAIRLNPERRFVIFSLFSSTVDYLSDRLQQDGLMDSCAVVSDTTKFDKDLHEANTIINYELPWNPVRLEERINVVDGPKQKEDKIEILNFKSPDLTGNEILHQALERMDIFKAYMDPYDETFRDDAKEIQLELLKAERSESCIQKFLKRSNERNPEVKNGLVGLSEDSVLDFINDTKTRNKYLRDEDLVSFVEDYLGKYETGCSVEPVGELCRRIKFSPETYVKFRKYLEDELPPFAENLTKGELFSFKQGCKVAGFVPVEVVNPLIRWICNEYKNMAYSYPDCYSLKLKNRDFEKGNYVFVVKTVSVDINGDKKKLKCFMMKVDSRGLLSEEKAEVLLNSVLSEGESASDVDLEEDFRLRLEDCYRSSEIKTFESLKPNQSYTDLAAGVICVE